MTADEARTLALAELEKSIRMGNDHALSMEHLARAQVYATLALSLDEIITVVAEDPHGPVRRFLDLGTSHLPQGLCEYLNSYDGVIAWRHGTETDQYGWWLWVPEDPQEHASDYEIPSEVLTVQLYARSHGCDWVMFDRDSDAIDELPRWEW